MMNGFRVFASALFVCSVPNARVNTRSLKGIVDDATRAAANGAGIRATNLGTGAVRSELTNNSGLYQFTPLENGVYRTSSHSHPALNTTVPPIIHGTPSARRTLRRAELNRDSEFLLDSAKMRLWNASFSPARRHGSGHVRASRRSVRPFGSGICERLDEAGEQ